jgi:hypothetical protein
MTTDYSTITSATMQPQTSMTVPTPPADTTNYSGITGGISDSIAKTYDSLAKSSDAGNKTQNDLGASITALMAEDSAKTADLATANETAGVNSANADIAKYTTQLGDLNASASALAREAQAIPIKVQQDNVGTGATDRGVAPQSTSQLRNNALKALSIGQQADIVSANLTGSQIRLASAKDKAQQIVDLKYKPIEDALAVRQKQYDLNKDSLDSIDKKATTALGVALKKEADDLATKKENEKNIANIQVEVAKNNAPQAIIDAVKNSTSLSQAISSAGKYLATPSTDVVKLNDNASILIDKNTGKILATYGSPSTSGSGLSVPKGSTPTTSALANLAPLVSGFNSVNAQKVFTSAISQLAQKPGNERAIAEKIVGTSLDNITDPNIRKMATGSFAISQQITRVQQLLDDYVANGGKTNLIRGTKEGAYQWTGNTSDPNLARIGVQLANSLDELARIRTGAVINPSEEASFKKLLPGIGKSPELNTAITQGIKTSMMADVENQLRFSITGDGLKVVKSALPDVFGDYRSSNPQTQLKVFYTANPQNKAVVDNIRKDHPEYTASDIMQIMNGN